MLTLSQPLARYHSSVIVKPLIFHSFLNKRICVNRHEHLTQYRRLFVP